MNIQYTEIKPGSVLLSKQYNWFQKGWAYITRKELPFNSATLFAEEAALLKIYNTHTSVIAEPKKVYSKKELKQLATLVETTTQDKEVAWITGNTKNSTNLFATINAIRPNTFKDKETDLNAFINSKYYNQMVLADDKVWSEYIY